MVADEFQMASEIVSPGCKLPPFAPYAPANPPMIILLFDQDL